MGAPYTPHAVHSLPVVNPSTFDGLDDNANSTYQSIPAITDVLQHTVVEQIAKINTYFEVCIRSNDILCLPPPPASLRYAGREARSANAPQNHVHGRDKPAYSRRRHGIRTTAERVLNVKSHHPTTETLSPWLFLLGIIHRHDSSRFGKLAVQVPFIVKKAPWNRSFRGKKHCIVRQKARAVNPTTSCGMQTREGTLIEHMASASPAAPATPRETPDHVRSRQDALPRKNATTVCSISKSSNWPPSTRSH